MTFQVGFIMLEHIFHCILFFCGHMRYEKKTGVSEHTFFYLMCRSILDDDLVLSHVS